MFVIYQANWQTEK